MYLPTISFVNRKIHKINARKNKWNSSSCLKAVANDQKIAQPKICGNVS